MIPLQVKKRLRINNLNRSKSKNHSSKLKVLYKEQLLGLILRKEVVNQQQQNNNCREKERGLNLERIKGIKRSKRKN